MFKPAVRHSTSTSPTCFNPSVGILGVQAGRVIEEWPPELRFQSLGRDSGCSSIYTNFTRILYMDSFNPSVGILGVQAGATTARRPGTKRFNPSVGILGVQAGRGRRRSSRTTSFQSLGRDSGCSSPDTTVELTADSDVSIPRSGFWVFKHFSVSQRCGTRSCFNPSVGILGVQAPPRQTRKETPQCFNPSVGILGVQAPRVIKVLG